MKTTFTTLGNHFCRACVGAASLLLSFASVKADTVTPLSIVEGPAAGSDSVTLVKTNQSATWNATANAVWLHAPSPGSYNTNHLQPFTFDANPGATRTGSITIDGTVVTITQLGSTFVPVTQATTVVTAADTGSDFVQAMAADPAGNIYFSNGNYLKKWTAATNAVSTLIDSSNTSITFTPSIALNAAGDVFIADRNGNKVFKWEAATSTLSTLVPSALSPLSVAVDAAGNVYFNDFQTVKRWNASTNSVSTVFTTSFIPNSLTLDAKGDLYFYNQSSGIRKRKANGGTISTVNVGTLREPYGSAIDAFGNLYFTDVGAALNDGLAAVRKWTAATAPSTNTTVPITGLNFPHSVAFDGNNTLIVADSGNFTVRTLPRAFVNSQTVAVPLGGGSGNVQFFPTTFSLTAPYAPSADQPWISITSTTGGNVSFTAASSGSARYGYVTVLGQKVLVQQGTPSLPALATATTSNLGPLTITLNGNVTADGGGPVSARGFVLFVGNGNASNVVLGALGSTTYTVSPASTGAYTFDATGLTPGVTYTFAAYATNGAGTGYSSPVVFSAPALTAATITSPTVADLGNGSVTLGGNVTSTGNTAVTARGIVVARTADNADPFLGDANVIVVNDASGGAGVFVDEVSGLLPSTGYSFKAFATNLFGTVYTSVGTFTTSAPTFTLGTSSLINGAAAGSDSVLLAVSPPNTPWTASSNDSWLQLNAGSASGTGNALIKFTFGANTGVTRTGTLTIAGQTLTVTQAPLGYVSVNRATRLGTALSSQTAGVAVDASGNVFADPSEGLLMRWSPATNAWTQLSTTLADYLSFLAADSAGNVFFSTRNTTNPSYSRRLDKWSAPSGPVSPVYPNAGTPGIGGFYASHIATDSKGNVWHLDGAVKRYNPTANVLTSVFNTPPNTVAMSLALDAADNVYVGLRGYSGVGDSIVKYDAVTGVRSVIVPEFSLPYPQSLTVDGSGNVYFTQAIYGAADSSVMKWSAATGTVSTVLAGLSPIDTSTGNRRVGQITVDRSGNLYIADNTTIVELPRVFVPGSQLNVPSTSGSGTLPAVIPNTGVALAPFAPVAEDSWLHIDSNTSGVVGYSWDASSTPRYGYLNVGGQRILVLQGTATSPSVGAPTANSVSSTLNFSSSVNSDGGAPITARGFVLALTSLNTFPQIGGAGVVVLNDSAPSTGSFTATATGILPNTLYTFRAFATNSSGTAYSGPIRVLTNALDLSLNLNSTGPGTTAVQQPDGMTVIYSGGYLTRYQTDNSIDYTLFVYFPTGGVNAMLSLADGSLVVGGSFSTLSSQTRNNMAMYDPSGNVTDFAPNVNGEVRCMALQRDGNILIGGDFTQVNGIARNRIARLYPNGTLDLTFNPNANGPVRSIAEQPDGKLLLGGDFTLIGTTLCNRLARVSTLGVVDATFVANADGVVNAITLQPDNSILVGGGFSTINSVARANLARLNPNGTLDNSFTATPNGPVNSIALQADGKLLIGGSFTSIGTIARLGFARLLANGNVDTLNANVKGYDPVNGIPKDGIVNGVTLLEDGRIIIAGDIDKVAGAQVQNAARLINDDVTQTLAPTGSTGVEWLRGTTLPEAIEVAFDLSTDGGTTWTVLGKGTRIEGGWALSGLSSPLPGTAQLRGRARTASGYGNGSGGWNYFEAPYTLAAQEIAVEQPENTNRASGDSIDLGTLGLNVPVLTTFTVRNSGGFDLTGINVTVSGTNAAMFTVTTKPLTTLGASDSTEFVVQAKLTSSGAKAATINIASNDADENPFVINLTATGAAAVLPVVVTDAAVSFSVASGSWLDYPGYQIPNLPHLPPYPLSAGVSGSVDPKGSLRKVYFDFGTTASYGMTVEGYPVTVTGTGTQAVLGELPFLFPHTLYHFRVRAAGDLGNASGADKTFTTPNTTPVAIADSVVVLPGAVAMIDALANDADRDEDTLTITAKSPVNPTTAGTVAIVANQLVFTAKTTFTGSATFTYTISDGFGGTATATATVSAGGAPTLSPTALNVPSAAGDYDVTITTNGAWAVTESPAIAWASQSQTKGSGTTTFKVSVLANTALAARSGHIFIGGVDLPITQAGVAVPAIGPLSGSFNTIVGESFSLTIPTTNAPVTYVVTGALPPGLVLTQATGIISGVPTAPGTYALKVKASNLAGAATATGATTPPNLEFSIVVDKLPLGSVGTFHGYVARSASAKFTPEPNLGARFELTTQSNGTCSGSVIEGATKKSFTGAKLVSRSGTPSTHTLTAALTGTTLFIDITLDPATSAASGILRNASGLSSAAITAWLKPVDATGVVVKATDYKNPLNTFRIENTDTANGPQGFGFGSFTIAEATRALTISGKLADGSVLTGSTFLGANNEVLIYQSLNSNRASCFGKLTVTAGSNKPNDNSITGTLTWLKPASLAAAKDTVYAAGFPLLTLDVKGGSFNAPPKGGRLLGALDQADNAQLIFDTAGSDAGFVQVLRIVNPNNVTGTTNTATISSPKLNSTAMPTLTFGTGGFGGSFIIAGTPARTAPFFGQIVTIGSNTQGYGYYLLPGIPGTGQTVTTSPKLSGRVELQMH